MANYKEEVGQQLQVANQQITLCQQEIQNPQEQLYLQNALGAIAKAWEIIDSQAK